MYERPPEEAFMCSFLCFSNVNLHQVFHGQCAILTLYVREVSLYDTCLGPFKVVFAPHSCLPHSCMSSFSGLI